MVLTADGTTMGWMPEGNVSGASRVFHACSTSRGSSAPVSSMWMTASTGRSLPVGQAPPNSSASPSGTEWQVCLVPGGRQRWRHQGASALHRKYAGSRMTSVRLRTQGWPRLQQPDRRFCDALLADASSTATGSWPVKRPPAVRPDEHAASQIAAPEAWS